MKPTVLVIDDEKTFRIVAEEALSAEENAVFRFEAGSVHLEKPVARAEFETWIAPELAAIERALEEALARAGLPPPHASASRAPLRGRRAAARPVHVPTGWGRHASRRVANSPDRSRGRPSRTQS